MYTPDGISRAFKEKGVREPMMADARFYGCGVNHLRTSLHQQQFRVYTRQTVAASYRFAAGGGGGRGVGGDRASARNSGTNNKHVGGRKLLSPPNNKGKKKTQWPRVASLLLGSTKWTESVWLPPAGPVTTNKKKTNHNNISFP